MISCKGLKVVKMTAEKWWIRKIKKSHKYVLIALQQWYLLRFCYFKILKGDLVKKKIPRRYMKKFITISNYFGLKSRRDLLVKIKGIREETQKLITKSNLGLKKRRDLKVQRYLKFNWPAIPTISQGSVLRDTIVLLRQLRQMLPVCRWRDTSVCWCHQPSAFLLHWN